MTTTRETEMGKTTERHVRITLEAKARPLQGAPEDLLRVQLQAGGVIVLDTSGAGVTVEDVVPPRTWTEGDVVAGEKLVYRRGSTQWVAWSDKGAPYCLQDAGVTKAVDAGGLDVLRYQAGDL